MIVIVNMKDAVSIGKGYVGKATMKTFGIEKFYTRSEKNITLDEIKKTKYIFICLPTPTISGRCFTDDIYEFIDKVKNPDSIFIIRSTVDVGVDRSPVVYMQFLQIIMISQVPYLQYKLTAP